MTSYIPTTSVAVTRARDVCTVTSLSPWFTEAEGTIYAEYLIPWTYTSLDTTSRRIIQADDGSDVDRVLLYAYAGNSRVALTETSTEQADLNVGAYTVGSARKVAVAWDTNDIAAIGNSGSLQTDTVAVIPSGLTTFRIGSASSAGSEPNGYIRKVRFYPRRMTN